MKNKILDPRAMEKIVSDSLCGSGKKFKKCCGFE